MWKTLIFVVASGIPICGGPVRREESAFQTSDEYQRIVNDKWKSKCYKATGVDVDIERMSRLNLEVDKCIEKAMNISQMREAVVATVPILANGSNFNFIDQRRADAFSRKYCPQYFVYYKCREILSPIQKDCYTADEIRGQNFSVETILSFLDFFCRNESEAIATLNDADFPQCSERNKDELLICLLVFEIARNPMSDKADEVCNAIETFRQCAVPVFDKCESSPRAAAHIKSWFTYVQATCANIQGTNSSS